MWMQVRSVITYDNVVSDVLTEAKFLQDRRAKMLSKKWRKELRWDICRCWLQPWRALTYDAVSTDRCWRSQGRKPGCEPQKSAIKRFVSLHPPYVTQKPSSRDLPRFFVFIVMSYKAPPFALFYVNTKQGHSSSQVLHKCRHYTGCLCAVMTQPS